jgi:3-dehydroquinate synthetase
MTGPLLGKWTIGTPEGGRCSIRVGRGVATASQIVPDGFNRVVFLTQPTVVELAQSLAQQTRTHMDIKTHVSTLPDGDEAKSLAVVEQIYQDLNSIGFTRSDLIVGVGGGALTDVAGFVAATYLRGVAVTYLATTLLGAVDAAIGGKTGVNVGGKNLAGVFRHPHRVVVDLDVLDAIPCELRREGAAEAVKAGFIASQAIVDLYETHGLDAPLEEIVPAAVEVKVQAVTADFKEDGTRAILNYGHTVGHAIEVTAGISHGDAVAIGMVAAGKISEDLLGFAGAQRQRAIIAHIGLPTAAKDVVAEQVERLMGHDKKRDSAGLRMVLLEDFGRPVVRHVSASAVRRGLNEIGVTV